MKPEDFTLKHLVSQLSIGQIRAIIIALGTACSISYFAGIWVSDAKISEKESQIAALQLRVESLLLDQESSKEKAEDLRNQIEQAKKELENGNFKEIFMSLYLNYIREVERNKTSSQNNIEPDLFSPSKEKNDLTSKVSEGPVYLTKFAKFVDMLIASKEVTLKKGGPGNESVVIFKDGTQWEVPVEVINKTAYSLKEKRNYWDSWRKQD